MDIGQGPKMDTIKHEITAIDVCYNTDKVVGTYIVYQKFSGEIQNFKKQFRRTYV